MDMFTQKKGSIRFLSGFFLTNFKIKESDETGFRGFVFKTSKSAVPLGNAFFIERIDFYEKCLNFQA